MLYALGSNGSGQLGVGHTDDLSEPQTVSRADTNSLWDAKQLAAGGNHTVILCDDGKVRATGNNEDGRCGLKDLTQTTRFTEVELTKSKAGKPADVKQVSASWSSTVLLCIDGNLHTCGTGNSGELGLGPDVIRAPTLQRIPDFPPLGTEVIFIASGMSHAVAILSNFEIYGWGNGRKGQIGEPGQVVWSPRKIGGIDFGATQAVCGKDFTLIAGEPSTGQIMVLGPNSKDRFGIQANVPASLMDWKTITASWGSICALASGETVAWGRDDHGQLPPPGILEIESIAAGSEHCLALTKTGKVLTWGWGEHGNCGTPTDEKGDVRGRWNEIGVPGRVSRIWAGCATSFIQAEELDHEG